ncbi:MAG: hypothetical protein WC080_04095 [Patescibacteria group bacterium]
MKKRTFNLILSLIFLTIAIVGFYMIWKNNSSISVQNTASYITLDISGVKDEAETLVQGRENNAGIPLPDPTTKMGKANPFANPE